MRFLIALSILGLAIVHGQDLFDFTQSALGPRGDDPQTRAALELRCGKAVGRERLFCEADLRQAFANGDRAADEIVRLHCTRFDNGWSAPASSPAICQSSHES